MAKKKKTTGHIIKQGQIAPGIYDLQIKTELAADAAAGQFVGVYPRNQATLLPRPISICEVDPLVGSIRLVYRIAGSGTAELAAAVPGEAVSLLGVLGNGFPVEAAEGKAIALMGGGIGIPPLLELAKAIGRRYPHNQPYSFLGYRDRHLFLREDFEQYSVVHPATEDGSLGVGGNVMNALAESGFRPEIIMACGPLPMLRAIKSYAAAQSIKAYISLEERMACGVGACLGCVGKTTAVDQHSYVHNARICTDGPVFAADAVDI